MLPKPLLSAVDLIVGYAGRPVLGPVNLAILPGEFVCVLGANGTGKSTLLRSLTGLQKPLGGGVDLEQTPLAKLSANERARKQALVLTDRVSAQAMRGYELAALGRQPHTGWSGRLSAEDHAVVCKALEDADAAVFADRLVVELSDGERQRILIARALAQEPVVLILDEPTAFLDLPRRIELMHLLRRVARLRSLAVLMSTHDLDLALRYADDVWLIDRFGQLKTGAPEDLVLAGDFERAFLNEGFIFDFGSGALRLKEESVGDVAVAAQGRVGVWLQRAVQRAGFRVSDQADVQVEVNGSGYIIRKSGQLPKEAGTVRELVSILSTEARL